MINVNRIFKGEFVVSFKEQIKLSHQTELAL